VTARWYVMSRGTAADQDYSWAAVGDAPGITMDEVDDLVTEVWPGHRLENLLEDEVPSLVLFHHQDTGTILVVTGLVPADAARDFQQREIRAAILGRAPDAEDEADLIGMAALALREKVAGHLPLSWPRAARLGFHIDRTGWTALLKLARSTLGPASPRPEETDLANGSAAAREPRLRLDTKTARSAVAERLVRRYHRHDGLGDLHGRVIVLRTPLLDEQMLRDLRPWQGLTTNDRMVARGEQTATAMNAGSAAEKLLGLGWKVGEEVIRAAKAARDEHNRRMSMIILLILAAAITAGALVIGNTGGSGPHPLPATPTASPATSTSPASTPASTPPASRPTATTSHQAKKKKKGQAGSSTSPAG
jgi:hypothetical protein